MAKLTQSTKYLIQRGGFYILGFILFYAPFAFYQKSLNYLFNIKEKTDIHSVCYRMFVANILAGKKIEWLGLTAITTTLIFVTAFFFGTLFCGKLCVAGGLPEYLSRIVPDKLKINWQKHINPVPIRYGMLAGFGITAFIGSSVACGFCNFTLVEKLILGTTKWDIGILGSSAILTIITWFGIFGIFAKGGRGFCSYICPVGAVQSFIHWVGSKLGFTYKIKFIEDRCVNCSACVKECPTGALKIKLEKLNYEILNCVTCGQCEHSCPKKAIEYGRGSSNWK